MFVIMPKNPADWQQAMFMMSYYKVKMETFSNGEDADSAYMVVGHTDDYHPLGQEDDDLQTAEMCFQMNWRQVGMKCPHCLDDGEKTCGHLTFNEPINSSAFDRAMGIS